MPNKYPELKQNKGVALAISLMLMMVLVTLSSLILTRILHENSLTIKEQQLSKAFYLAEAGAHAGLYRLNRLINGYLLNEINASPPQSLQYKISQFLDNNDSLGFLTEFTRAKNIPQFTATGGKAIHQGTLVNLETGDYQYTITIRPKNAPKSIAADIWSFPFYFTIISKGKSGSSEQIVACSGDFNIRIQRDDFSKYILFKDHTNFDSSQADELLFIASANDIQDTLTWQEGQP